MLPERVTIMFAVHRKCNDIGTVFFMDSVAVERLVMKLPIVDLTTLKLVVVLINIGNAHSAVCSRT